MQHCFNFIIRVVVCNDNINPRDAAWEWFDENISYPVELEDYIECVPQQDDGFLIDDCK